MSTTKTAIVLALFCTLLITAGQVLWKLALEQNTGWFGVVNSFFLIGSLSYAVAAFIFITSLKSGDLSVIYPITATSFIWVTLGSPIVFPTEIITIGKMVGVLLILLGVSSIGYGSGAK